MLRPFAQQEALAHTTTVDACDEQAVKAYVDHIVVEAGDMDISCKVISYGDVQQRLRDLAIGDFVQPIITATRTHLATTRAAARHMIHRRSGVILLFGGGGPQTLPGLGGFKIALDALESVRRQWTVELAQHGIRVVTLKTGGIAESIPDTAPRKDAIATSIAQQTLRGRAATLADVGTIASFAASDLARTLTATDINISCGALID